MSKSATRLNCHRKASRAPCQNSTSIDRQRVINSMLPAGFEPASEARNAPILDRTRLREPKGRLAGAAKNGFGTLPAEDRRTAATRWDSPLQTSRWGEA